MTPASGGEIQKETDPWNDQVGEAAWMPVRDLSSLRIVVVLVMEWSLRPSEFWIVCAGHSPWMRLLSHGALG